MNQKLLISLVVLTTISGCTSLRDGLLGHYHKYDAFEYQQTVQITKELRGLENSCDNLATVIQSVHSVNQRVEFLIAYAQGRPYNKHVTTQAQDLKKLLNDTQDRTAMSEFFCRERAKNIVKGAEILQTTSGSKPE